MYAGQQNQIKYTQLVNSVISDKPNRQFHLTKLLGGGNEGGVFLADMTYQNQKGSYALKIQNKMRDDEKTFIDNLILYQNQYEIPNSNENNPSCIIRIYERFNWNNQDVVIMEIAESDLYSYCKKNKMSLLDKSNICKNIVRSICILHSFKYFHRDIKPENFVKVGSQFKLCDFGLIKPIDARLQTINVGSPMFQAPELIKQDTNMNIEQQDSPVYNEKVDMWALGCVLYEILKEEECFQGQTEAEIHNLIKSVVANPQIMKEKIQQLKISQAWQNILIKMFDPNFENRISSQEAFDFMNKDSIFPQFQIQPQIMQKNNLQQQQKQWVNNPQFPLSGIAPQPQKIQLQKVDQYQYPPNPRGIGSTSIQNLPNKQDQNDKLFVTDIIPSQPQKQGHQNPNPINQNESQISVIPETQDENNSQQIGESQPNVSVIQAQMIESQKSEQNAKETIDEEVNLTDDEKNKIEQLLEIKIEQFQQIKKDNQKGFQDIFKNISEIIDKVKEHNKY